ncbi:putative F-box/FBD/LRR-repeat protein At3g49030 [Bidens hawaiensis]|uniref:putative F-box/FBD/LRR-repeat protein At3g49030 n=1 Tax=Bidens hawaiensis TaxID=980011 RepID=UPI004049607F
MGKSETTNAWDVNDGPIQVLDLDQTMRRSMKVDRLSILPEELQSHILSLMPTKFAVQSCILSKRWRYTWMGITNLDFDDINPLGLSDMETFVDWLFSSSSSHINKLVLRVPKLEHLFFDGTLDWLFVMEDVSSLVETSFSFRENSFNNNFMVELLKGISGVKLLSLEKVRDGKAQDSSFLKIISASPMTVFPNMERLELKGYWRFELIPKFLESFPELKELYIEKLEGSRWIAPKLVPACMLAKLTTIKFFNLKWRKGDIPFFKFLLGNAKALRMVTISLEKSSIEEEKLKAMLILDNAKALRISLLCSLISYVCDY